MCFCPFIQSQTRDDVATFTSFSRRFLPTQFEGVTFLDRSDRQMVHKLLNSNGCAQTSNQHIIHFQVLLRGSGRVVPASQCGVPMFNRFGPKVDSLQTV